MTSGQREYQRRGRSRWLDTLNGKWRTLAACRPETGVAEAAGVQIPDMVSESLNAQREAASFCHRVCSVRKECLQWARDQGDLNYVLGGTTERERRHLFRREAKERREKQELEDFRQKSA